MNCSGARNLEKSVLICFLGHFLGVCDVVFITASAYIRTLMTATTTHTHMLRTTSMDCAMHSAEPQPHFETPVGRSARLLRVSVRLRDDRMETDCDRAVLWVG